MKQKIAIEKGSKFEIFVVGRAVIKNEKEKYLLLRRASKEAYGGFWEIPGGKLKTLEAIHESVTREVFEETDLVITITPGAVHVSSYISQEGSNLGCTFLNLIYFETKTIAGNIRLSDEHDTFGWFTVKEMFNLDVVFYLRRPLTEILLSN